MEISLTERQRIPTSGARAVSLIAVGDVELLAIPQLAYDVAGQAPGMNAGDSDTDLLLLRRDGGRFVPWGKLAAPGGEDAEFFTIQDRAFLAVASLRCGSGPYRFDVESQIFTWVSGEFVPFQKLRTFGAKQFKHWRIGERDFLGLAQGLRLPGMEDCNLQSVVYEWDGDGFVEQQRIPSQWAYNWHPFTVGDTFFVAHAEHIGPSVLYRWDGDRLVPHQQLVARAGRAFASFDQEGATYLLAAGLFEPPTLLRWRGDRFEAVQVLEGLGARELAVLRIDDALFVIRVNFIVGTPEDPDPVLDSCVYAWASRGLEVVASFPTSGGTDAALLGGGGGELQMVVSNSLSAELRFATDTIVYSLDTNGL
jgi:hypothetical protein